MNQLATPDQHQAGRAVSTQQQLRQQVRSMKPDWQKALPRHVSVEKFERVALTAINQNPDLARSDRRALFGALTKAAQDGLLPDGREAALVLFKGQPQYMPMIAGILKKVRNSGDLSTISAHVVYENDDFDYELGDFERIKHKPALDNRGRPLCAYAIAHLKDGSVMREVMSIEEIEQVRQVSRAKDGGPWKAWWSEMARKTVLRRLSKRLPMSTDLEEAIQHDDQFYQPERAAAPGATQAVLEQEPQAIEESEVTVDDSTEHETATTPTQSGEAQQPNGDGVPLVTGAGEVLREYTRIGDYVNALEKLIDESDDPAAVWDANSDPVERIYRDRPKARERIDQIRAKTHEPDQPQTIDHDPQPNATPPDAEPASDASPAEDDDLF